MMLYAIICNDKAFHQDLRLKTRPEHLEYLKSLKNSLKFAGPFTDDNGQATGTLMVVMAETLTDAQHLAANDPYVKAGLFETTEIRAWKWTINNPVSETY